MLEFQAGVCLNHYSLGMMMHILEISFLNVWIIILVPNKAYVVLYVVLLSTGFTPVSSARL